MCGINGGLKLTEETIIRLNKALAHRGPDGSGVFVDEYVGLGHTRLSIIDVSDAGSQPMHYDKEWGATRMSAPARYTITFNGEIYNYLELRTELTAAGAVFHTESDTEVILAAYARWGKDCVTRFNGMWAFCIYDREHQELFLSRDRLGVKPLYYYQNGRAFLFASDLKALIAGHNEPINRKDNVNRDAVELFFSLGYIPAPHSIYKNVFQLPPAHTMTVDIKTGACTTARYWDVPVFNPSQDKAALIATGRELLYDATRLRMRADVPVGAFLSGGLDSTSVVAAMREYTSVDKLHTFSIGFTGTYDETPYIELARTALGTIHHHQYFTQEDFAAQGEIFADIFAEPMSDHSGFPTHAVSALARKSVTVSLSGDGGDEVFGGYGSHVLGARLDLLKRLPAPIRRLIASLPAGTIGGKISLRSLILACRLTLGKPEDFVAEASFGDTLRTDAAKTWLRQAFAASYKRGSGSFAEALRIFDVLYNTLPYKYLTKVDRASMYHSLEVRSPFLDYRFYEYAQTIPTKWKTTVRKGKVILGEIVHDLVPAAIITRKKQGFEPPVYEWIQDEALEPLLRQAVTTLSSIAPAVAAWYEKYPTLHMIDKKHLFRLYAFALWWKRWIEEK